MMELEKINKLRALGLDSKNEEEAFDDLIFLCWHLLDKAYLNEEKRFASEINRLLKPTN